MATLAGRVGRAKPLGAGLYEKTLGIAAAVTPAAVLAALAQGWAEWGRVPAVFWMHLLTTLVALTPVLMFGRRGSGRYRKLGQIWVTETIATAAATLFARESDGGWRPIHVLSVLTLAGMPYLWWTAHTHRIAAHRCAVGGTVTGALLLASFFTFQYVRMLGRWLLG